MLGPHDGENAELDEVRFASKQLLDAIEFFFGEVVAGDYFGSDGLHYYDLRASSFGSGGAKCL